MERKYIFWYTGKAFLIAVIGTIVSFASLLGVTLLTQEPVVSFLAGFIPMACVIILCNRADRQR